MTPEDEEMAHCEAVADEMHGEQLAFSMGAREFSSPHDVLVKLVARERAAARDAALEEAAVSLCGTCRAGKRPVQGMHRYHSCHGEDIRALKSGHTGGEK